jgi:ribonuclease VapC
VTLFEKAAESNKATLIAAPNWAEVRCQVERKAGAQRWTEIREKLLALPLEVVSAGADLAEAAGAIKVSRKMSLADCFAAALAKERRADLYTGDPEFKAVETEIKVVWI